MCAGLEKATSVVQAGISGAVRGSVLPPHVLIVVIQVGKYLPRG